jgi:hypothetical protein
MNLCRYASDPSRVILHVLLSANALVSSLSPKCKLFKIAYCKTFSTLNKKLVVSLPASCVRGAECSKSTFDVCVVCSRIILIKI